jgi:DMSO reductase family type II enzyme heme b subunit
VAHNGSDIAFRLQWQDASADTGAEGQDDTGFPDAAALLFPTAPKAPLMSMGAPGLPVNAWYWRADEPDRGRQVSAEGLGSSETVDRDLVKVQGGHRNGEWHVVIARAMQATASRPVAQLGAGGRIGVSFAIWEGSRGERAGIKAFALGPHEGWHELVLDGIA